MAQVGGFVAVAASRSGEHMLVVARQCVAVVASRQVGQGAMMFCELPPILATLGESRVMHEDTQFSAAGAYGENSFVVGVC